MSIHNKIPINNKDECAVDNTFLKTNLNKELKALSSEEIDIFPTVKNVYLLNHSLESTDTKNSLRPPVKFNTFSDNFCNSTCIKI